jgi:ATP-binding cassette subfamily C protein
MGPNAAAFGMMHASRQAYRLLNGRERVHFAVLMAITPLAAFGEMAAVAAMIPFLGAVVDPAMLDASSLPARLVQSIGVARRGSAILLMGAGACLVLVLTNALIVASVWMMLRFSWSLHHRLSTTLLRRYLGKPYAFFLSKNSARLATNLIVEVGQVTEGFLVPGLTAFGRGAAALALLVLLGAAEPILALTSLGLITGIYTVFYLVMARKRLRELGLRRVHLSGALGLLISEAFGGIKDVKLVHAEQAFSDTYDPLSRSFSNDAVVASMLATTPRYLVEAMAFGGVVLISMALSAGGAADGRVVALLGMFAFAGYRLMPAIQHVFASFVQMRANLPAFEHLCRDLAAERDEDAPPPGPSQAPPTPPEPLSPKRTISLREVAFAYNSTRGPVLEHFNLSVKAKTTTGIVGPTGSGKTTVVDLLLGLLRPAEGELRIDGVSVDSSNLERWQRSVGYVPQHIYLSDTSISRNVAFGVPDHEIDQTRVEEACRHARIHDFVLSLPKGYDTTVGERGSSLSGGERQRIGIARALYRRPEVLILDEATSALDRETEEEVMNAIQHLAGRKTLIMIAHRESTLRQCEVIYRIARGRLEVVGNYAALLREESRRPKASEHSERGIN